MQFLMHDRNRPLAMSNTYHLFAHDAADPVTFDVLKALGDSGWMSGLIDAYVTLLSSSATLDAVVLRQPHDPQDPTAIPAEFGVDVETDGSRTANGSLPAPLCALLVGHADSASRRARGHVFLPPSLDGADISDQGVWKGSGDYNGGRTAVNIELNKLLFTAGGGHAGGAANDFDLCTYSVKARTVNAPNYLFRWAS